jgi:hypothetical protein
MAPVYHRPAGRVVDEQKQDVLGKDHDLTVQICCTYLRAEMRGGIS